MAATVKNLWRMPCFCSSPLVLVSRMVGNSTLLIFMKHDGRLYHESRRSLLYLWVDPNHWVDLFFIFTEWLGSVTIQSKPDFNETFWTSCQPLFSENYFIIWWGRNTASSDDGLNCHCKTLSEVSVYLWQQPTLPTYQSYKYCYFLLVRNKPNLRNRKYCENFRNGFMQPV